MDEQTKKDAKLSIAICAWIVAFLMWMFIPYYSTSWLFPAIIGSLAILKR